MKALKIIGVMLLAIAVLAAAFLAYLTFTEYKPAPVETLTVVGEAEAAFEGDTLRVVSFNTGYAGLGAGADFFMDGGEGVRSTDREQMIDNLHEISRYVILSGADVVLLQEVDVRSTRTYGYQQAGFYDSGLPTVFAYNYRCAWVPYPLPMIGQVNSGLQTISRYPIASAERIALPCPFSWPVSAANLKRCLLVSRIDLADGKQLVVVNLHLEAYDDGAGRLAQTEQLWQLLEEEYTKGNYVIAGGDFNQVFPGTLETYPIQDPTLWTPGVLSEDDLPDGWQYAYDANRPTCRLLNQPYDPDDPATQYYVIDGFILSPNLEVDRVCTHSLCFASSDHNPVELDVTLR